MSVLIGKRIKKVRQELGLTQQQVAKMVGFSRQALSKIEKGQSESPDPSNLISLAKALKNNFGEPSLDKYLNGNEAQPSKKDIIEKASIDEILSIKFPKVSGRMPQRSKAEMAELKKKLDAQYRKMKEEEEKYGE